ncbi:MAG TPA: PAS domain-containing protein [Caulobacteraceae bacterium]|jgi:hypothetical protein
MFASNTEQLLGYWRTRRGGLPAPRRADIDVADFAPLAPQVFIAETAHGGDIRFRLAGEAVAALRAAPLNGESLLSLWAAEHRGRLSRLLARALAEAEPLVVLASASSADGQESRFELLFAPLAGPTGAYDRFLGLWQPTPVRAAMRIGPLAIVALNGFADEARRANLRLAALDGRRIA